MNANCSSYKRASSLQLSAEAPCMATAIPRGLERGTTGRLLVSRACAGFQELDAILAGYLVHRLTCNRQEPADHALHQ